MGCICKVLYVLYCTSCPFYAFRTQTDIGFFSYFGRSQGPANDRAFYLVSWRHEQAPMSPCVVLCTLSSMSQLHLTPLRRPLPRRRRPYTGNAQFVAHETLSTMRVWLVSAPDAVGRSPTRPCPRHATGGNRAQSICSARIMSLISPARPAQPCQVRPERSAATTWHDVSQPAAAMWQCCVCLRRWRPAAAPVSLPVLPPAYIRASCTPTHSCHAGQSGSPHRGLRHRHLGVARHRPPGHQPPRPSGEIKVWSIGHDRR